MEHTPVLSPCASNPEACESIKSNLEGVIQKMDEIGMTIPAHHVHLGLALVVDDIERAG